MKFRLFYLLILFFSTLKAQTFNDTLNFHTMVVYKTTFVGDTSNKSEILNENCVLFINDSISLSESFANYDFLNNNIIQRKKTGNLNLSWTIIKTQKTIKTFDWLTNQIGDLFDTPFGYRETNDAFHWELRDDTLTIGNWLCQKAIVDFGNRKWVAWFTNEIPISEGPYKFMGLPGLIVKIEDEKKEWCFEIVELEVNKIGYSVPIFDVENLSLLNKLDFYKTKKHINDNYLTIKETRGNFVLDSKNRAIFKKRIDDRIKSLSNWIEFYP